MVEYSENNGLSCILCFALAVDKICACAEKHGYQQEKQAPLRVGIICRIDGYVIFIKNSVQGHYQSDYAAEGTAEGDCLISISVNAYSRCVVNYGAY